MGGRAQRYLVFETAAGVCAIAWSGLGITGFRLPVASASAIDRSVRRRWPGAEPGRPPTQVAEAVAGAIRYFEGEATDFSRLGLDLDEPDGFRRQVYAAARRIAWGRTTTYGALASQLGAGPEAARDVGQALARNPVPLIIPCHRVLAAGGKPGGFSAPGGAATKLRMLALEGIRPGTPPAQASFGF